MHGRERWLLYTGIAVIFLVLAGFLFTSWNDARKPPIVPLLDTMNHNYFFDDEGNQVALNEIIESKPYSVIYYLSEDCQVCMSELERMNNIADEAAVPSINHAFVWQNAVPVENGHNSKAAIYSLKGKANISSMIPYVYILNDKKEVVFSTPNLDYVQAKLASITKSEVEQ
jgi:hypothetical protein